MYIGYLPYIVIGQCCQEDKVNKVPSPLMSTFTLSNVYLNSYLSLHPRVLILTHLYIFLTIQTPALSNSSNPNCVTAGRDTDLTGKKKKGKWLQRR